MAHRIRGFTVIEILIVVGIIGLLSTIVAFAIGPTLQKGRDTARKSSLAQVGRFFSAGGCFLPDAGGGDYDIADIFSELLDAHPRVASFISRPPVDPRGGTVTTTKYRYRVTADGGDCALYANLEHINEPITLDAFSDITPGGGNGVLLGDTPGMNGTSVFFQVTN